MTHTLTPESSHLVFRMPFRRSGIHGTKKFISFVVIITITSFIIYLSSPEFCASVLAKPESVCVCVCMHVGAVSLEQTEALACWFLAFQVWAQEINASCTAISTRAT